MELKELMKKLEISEDYIIEAAQNINKICKQCGCNECPFNTEYGCILNTTANVRVDKMVKLRIKKLLYHNHMEKVAEMLGVKIGEKFGVATPTSDVVNTYYLTEQGIFSEDNMSAEITLSNLLIGNAHIIKGE